MTRTTTDPETTPALWRRVLRWTRVPLIAYGLALVLLAIFQSRLIYFPGRPPSGSPADLGLDFEDLRLPVGDDDLVHAWYVPHDNPRGTAIFAHGNAGSLEHRLSIIAAMRTLRLNVLAFDYRGFGHSTGSPSEAATYEDMEAAWRWVTEQKNETPARIVIWGRSLGGGVAVELAKRKRPAALVVESTFSSLVDTASHHYPWVPVRLLLRHRYDSIAKIDEVTIPKLFAHAPDDEVIPHALGRKLYEAAPEPKTWAKMGGGHQVALAEQMAGRVVLERFLTEALGR